MENTLVILDSEGTTVDVAKVLPVTLSSNCPAYLQKSAWSDALSSITGSRIRTEKKGEEGICHNIRNFTTLITDIVAMTYTSSFLGSLIHAGSGRGEVRAKGIDDVSRGEFSERESYTTWAKLLGELALKSWWTDLNMLANWLKSKRSDLSFSAKSLKLLRGKQKFSFIKRVDKGRITTVKDLESWHFER